MDTSIKNIWFSISCIISISAYTIDERNNMKKLQIELEIPATEDLMKEHGILNRVLLIYEETIKRIDRNESFESSLSEALTIIKSFIENYHEKNEEEYIFPLFERKKINTRLTKTLRIQHQRGREITAKLQEFTKSKHPIDNKTKRTIKSLLNKFIRMYRPHEAREDTVLFPKVRSLMTENEFKELSEKFEESEHQIFGKEGFKTILKKVESIEKKLGIYNLDEFTPSITSKAENSN